MLNDAKLRGAKPREKAYKLTDSHRLYLEVKPSGGKLWRWNYSSGGKQKSMNFGIYPMISLLDARAKRDEAYAEHEREEQVLADVGHGRMCQAPRADHCRQIAADKRQSRALVLWAAWTSSMPSI